MITKKLKFGGFEYDENKKVFRIYRVYEDGNEAALADVEIPRHYGVSFGRFLLRVLQKGKPRK